MKAYPIGWMIVLLVFLLPSCGTPPACKAGDSQACTCLDLKGTQTCKDDGSGFGACRCTGPQEEISKESVTPDGSAETVRPEEPVAEKKPTPEEPAAEKKPTPEEPVAEKSPTPEEPVAEKSPTPEEPVAEKNPPEPATCASDEFKYNNVCYKVDLFCKGQIQQPGFPAFSQDDQAAMRQPFEIEFDLITKKPLFCKTADGFYYLSGAGYGVCDKDKDGWINIEAYRAVTSTDRQIQDNARCSLKKFQHIVYHTEGQTPQVQTLTAEASMVETFRNDGGGKLIERPIYTKNQAALPKGSGSSCAADTDCSGQICYQGHCFDGRRFEPAEVNTLTKGCIAGLDLNDNKLDDAGENPGDTPDPASEFKPLLAAGYYVEIHYGHFQADYDDKGTKLPVYHIYERPRSKAAAQQGLALLCQQQTDAFRPDYWKTCTLKDNQQCQDPNDPTKLKPGLNLCWLKDTQRLLPSLFQCAVFDTNKDKTKPEGYFHPDNHGFSANYNRTLCNFKATINDTDPAKRDLEFECTPDDGTRKPDPTKQEVGWACVASKVYAASADYLGGCIDEKAEKVCGSTKDNEPVTYVKHEVNSYGLVRAYAPCGQSNGKGECDKAWRVCSGGTWLDCDKCDNCPQTTTGQQAACPGGVWPADSCKRLKGPSAEICDGKDNDCDGAIDEGLATTRYYKDGDKDTYGDPFTFVDVCPAQKPLDYVTRSGDCDDTSDKVSPVSPEICDGKDNNCNGQIDENQTFVNYYKDDDGDGVGEKTNTPAHRGCLMTGDPSKLCTGAGTCLSLAYNNSSGQSRTYKTSNTDCCDQDANTKPGQTTFFTAKNACGSWDYNCDGADTTDISLKLCNCAKSVPYSETTRAWCRMNTSQSSKYCEWDWDASRTSNGTATSTNATNKCQLDKTHAYKLTSNFSETCSKSCAVAGSDSYEVNCDTDINDTFTPTAGDGTSPLFAMETNQFGTAATCHFLQDGSVPTCGSITSTIAKSAADTRPTYEVFDKQVCSGSKGKCTVTWRHYCDYNHTVYYNASYSYFKISSIAAGTIVGCR